MKTRFWVLACICLPFLHSTPASAHESLIGHWAVVETQVGPWYDGGGAKPDVDPKLAHATLIFDKDSVTAPPPLGCKKVRYTVTSVGPDYLFEGSLKNPAKDAAALGFKSAKITSINEACARADADLEMDIAMIDQDTAVFGLNNVVYKIKRTEIAPR